MWLVRVGPETVISFDRQPAPIHNWCRDRWPLTFQSTALDQVGDIAQTRLDHRVVMEGRGLRPRHDENNWDLTPIKSVLSDPDPEWRQ